MNTTGRQASPHTQEEPTFGQRLRRRLATVALVGITVLAYAATCALWQYLTAGSWLDLRPAAFRNSLLTPLADVFRHPLSIFSYPWMIITYGGLLAGMVFVPITLSTRMHAAVGLSLTLGVLALAQMPVLAVVIALGCALAVTVRRVGDFSMVAAGAGMVPVTAYLALSGFVGVDSTAVLPLQRWVLTVPILLAVGVGLLASGTALMLGKVPGLRRTAEAVVLGAVVAAPVVVFWIDTGPDELRFGQLSRDVTPGDAVLEPAALYNWHRVHGTEGLTGQAIIREPRNRLVDRCNAFLQEFPRSSRRPEVLWIKAQLRSLQLDEQALAAGLVKPGAGYVLPESRGVWEELATSHSAAPQAVVAQLHLGELDLRDGEIRRAYERLKDRAEPRLSELLETLPADDDNGGIFRPVPVVPARAYYADSLFETRRLVWLVETNNALTDPNAAEALGALLSLNPMARLAPSAVQELASRYAGTSLGGNWKVAAAGFEPDVYERAKALLQVATHWRDDPDAAIVANYELGILAMKEPVLQLMEGMEKPEAYLKRVCEGPVNPWQHVAEQRRTMLRSTQENTTAE